MLNFATELNQYLSSLAVLSAWLIVSQSAHFGPDHMNSTTISWTASWLWHSLIRPNTSSDVALCLTAFLTSDIKHGKHSVMFNGKHLCVQLNHHIKPDNADEVKTAETNWSRQAPLGASHSLWVMWHLESLNIVDFPYACDAASAWVGWGLCLSGW